jgi:hypothetical protein
LNTKKTFIILYWGIFFSWLIVGMLIVRWLIFPFVIEELLKTVAEDQKHGLNPIKFFTIIFSIPTVLFLTYPAFNGIAQYFSGGISLWQWLQDRRRG